MFKKTWGIRPKRTIAHYRQRFRISPRGYWSHAVGTFGMVMNEHWEFKADHTGIMVETGTFGGELTETHFEWKEVAPFTIACRVTKWPEYDDDEYEDDDEPDEEDSDSQVDPEAWRTIRYDFIMTPTDVGDIVGMVSLAEDGTPHEGFWLSSIPLSNNDRW